MTRDAGGEHREGGQDQQADSELTRLCHASFSSSLSPGQEVAELAVGSNAPPPPSRRRSGSCPAERRATRSPTCAGEGEVVGDTTAVTSESPLDLRGSACRWSPRSSGRGRWWARRRAPPRGRGRASGRGRRACACRPRGRTGILPPTSARRTRPSFSRTLAAISLVGEAGVLAQRKGDVVEDGHRVEEGAALEQHGDAAAQREEISLRRAARCRCRRRRRCRRRACSRPSSWRRVTLLPLPERPRITRHSPRRTSKSMPSSTCARRSSWSGRGRW